MKMKHLRYPVFLILFICSCVFSLQAQNCDEDIPEFFRVEQDDSGNCFLVLSWPEEEMPELTCGSPGIAIVEEEDDEEDEEVEFEGKLKELKINGLTVYEKSNKCKGTIYNLAYHPTQANSYITTVSMCDVANQPTIQLEVKRTEGSSFSCNISNLNPLPVELIDFETFQEGESIVLEWATASETNNRHFEIERSEDGIVFETLGVRTGAGNTSDITAYNFMDESPLSGDNYYRLKQVDFDGAFEYSEILVIKNENTFELNFYPTLIINNGTLQFESAERVEVLIQVYDLNGRVFKTERLPLEKGSNRLEMDFSFLPKGMYFLSSYRTGRQQVNTTRFIKS